jgi:hypothetical protein
MSNPGKDKVTAHLDKNIISNIIQTARASLKEPSRPFTPGESQRTLFSSSDVTRPPSSYSIRNLSKDLEPLKSRPVVLDPPIQTSKKPKTDELNFLPRKPVKVTQEAPQAFDYDEENETLAELKNLMSILDKMRLHQEIRKLYETNDLDIFLDTLTNTLAALKYLESKPKWATCEEVLKMLALTLENFEKEPKKVLKIAKCLLENITKHEILYEKKKKNIIMNQLAAGAVKVIYQYSKNNQNDQIFLEENLFETVYNLLINIVSEDPYVEIDLPYDFLIFLLGILKNITNSSEIAKHSIQIISPLSSLLPTVLLDTIPHRNPKHQNLLVQVTGILKNISSSYSLEEFMSHKIIERLVLTIHLYRDLDLALNCMKAISKVSLEQPVCEVLTSCMPVFFNILAKFESPAIVIRCCYVLANILTILEDARSLTEINWVEILIGISNKSLGNQEDINIDVLVKTVRLLANLVSAPHIGDNLDCPDKLLKLLIDILCIYNVNQHEELILNTVACITNLLYFDSPGKDYISQQLRFLVFSKLSPLLVTNFNEELISETLRAFGNLTRHESICKELSTLYILDIFFILLDHSNWNVIYYDLGCLINVSSLAKELIYTEKNFDILIGMIDQTGVFEMELTNQLLMIFCNLCSLSKGLVPWESVAGEENVKKIGVITKSILDEIQNTQENNKLVENVLSVGFALMDLMPKPLVPCSFEGCGRKFATAELLKDHWNRRHA